MCKEPQEEPDTPSRSYCRRYGGQETLSKVLNQFVPQLCVQQVAFLATKTRDQKSIIY